MSGFSPIAKHYIVAFFHSSFFLLPNICKYSGPYFLQGLVLGQHPCRLHNRWPNPIYEKAYYLHVTYSLPSINFFLIFITLYLVILGGCVFVSGSQMTTCGSQFSSSTIWVPRSNSSHVAGQQSSLSTEPSHQCIF